MEKRLYITQNLINGKIYAGKHLWKKGTKYMGSGYALKKAFIKYGKDNFRIRWLKLNIRSSEDLDQREIRLIRLLKYRYGNKCYNIQRGGCGGYFTYYMSDEEKQKVFDKISNSKKMQYANGLTDKQIKGREQMRLTRLHQHQNPTIQQKYKQSQEKRIQSLQNRKTLIGLTEGEIRRNKFLETNSCIYVTYKIVYPDNHFVIETKCLKEFQEKYNTEDIIFSHIKKLGSYTFKRRISTTKHMFPVGTTIFYVSEEKVRPV